MHEQSVSRLIPRDRLLMRRPRTCRETHHKFFRLNDHESLRTLLEAKRAVEEGRRSQTAPSSACQLEHPRASHHAADVAESDDQASARSPADQIEPSALLSVALFSLSLAIFVVATSTMFDSAWSQALRDAFINLPASLAMQGGQPLHRMSFRNTKYRRPLGEPERGDPNAAGMR